jgi:hypothetical protein
MRHYRACMKMKNNANEKIPRETKRYVMFILEEKNVLGMYNLLTFRNKIRRVSSARG